MIVYEYQQNNFASKEEFLDTCLGKISPVKKVTVFFDPENFLLTDYQTNNNITLVAEGWNGDQLHLYDANCGYIGTGPTNTAKILTELNVDTELANKLICHPGLQLEFDKSGNLLKDKITTNAFFSSQIEHESNCRVFLDEYTYVERNSHKVYFINPQVDCINAVFNLIDKIQPFELQYFLGNDSPLDSGYFPHIKYNKKSEKLSGITGVNLILKGLALDLLFLLDKKVARSFVNVIHYYLLKEPLFDDTSLISTSKTGFKSLTIKLLFQSPKTKPHGFVKIYRSTERR